MSEKPMRRTQARIAERERQRAQVQGQRGWSVLLLGIAVVAFAVAGYLIFEGTRQPAPATGGGVVGPRLQVDREQIDLGDRKFNQPVRAVFTVRNAGDAALNLNVQKQVAVLEGC